jgi:NAD(P)-dependent dehydrogenase (short-subunit alcohol dehydrogenase family)
MPGKNIDITIPDLSGKRAVVTGASDGMGLGMAAAGGRWYAGVTTPISSDGRVGSGR